MKGAVLALFCAIALASAELNENGCPINPYVDVLIPHPNCNKYYQCVQGDRLERKCASSTVFNVEIQECDWPENVDCGDRTPVAPVSSEEADSDSNSKGEESGSEENRTGEDSDSSSDNGNEDGDNNNNGGDENGDHSEAAEICAADGSDGVLVAHENCNQFYKCSEGVPIALKCYGTLLFNPTNNQCDWPENVNCEDRNTDSGNDGNGDNGNGDNNSADNDNGNDGSGDNGDGDNDNGNNVGGGNGDSSKAPEICAAEGSDGVLVAHENCGQFYKCLEGVPVALKCYGNLVFNPANDQCDWPENVNCEDRNTDSGNDGNGDSDNEDNNSGNNNGSDGNDNTEDDNGNDGNEDNDNANIVGAGHDDPSKAPEICATEGSEGVLVAHENCGQFYQCSEGVPVARKCYGNLLFNPSNDQCDWPENVNCEDRNTDSGNAGNGDNGSGENSSGDNDNGNDGNGDNNSEDNDNGNDGSDGENNSEDNGNGDNDNENNIGGGHDDPSKAPEICAAEGSEDVLVAHENCGQFYQCSEGVPVARHCYGKLLFNPANDRCDWPENVDCGSRSRFTSFNKHLRFRM